MENKSNLLVNPQKIRHDIETCAREVPLAWWNHIPGGTKVKEYFDATSLHGLKYFSESGRSLSERYYWIVALLVVYVCAIVSVYDQSLMFFNTPVLMSINSKATPIWDIPFPAITICSENQVRPSFFNYSEFLANRTGMTKREAEIFDYMSLICQSNYSGSTLELFSSDILASVHSEIWAHCNDTFSIQWLSQDVDNPCGILQPALTSVGACHTFNGLPGDLLYRSSVYNLLHEHNHQVKSRDEGVIWSPDDGYRGKQAFSSPPWRTQGGGLGQSAVFILNLNSKDFDDTCSFGGHGFLVVLHSPAELPSLSHPTTYVHVDEMATIKVIPDIKLTDQELRYWSPQQRGCFFQDERPLQYFQFYTEKNCDLECESNMSLSICGCVPYFHPRTKNIPVCGPEKVKCYIQGLAKSVDPEAAMETECNCLPSCFEIEYRISVANFRRNYTIASLKGIYKDGYNFIPEDNFAIATVQYQAQKVTAMKRIAVFGLSDFIANIGGLLGLFLGFSFLSLFEIVYFCTLRFRKRRPSRKISASTVGNSNILV